MARLAPRNYRPILQYHFIVEFSEHGMELGQNTQNYAKSSDLPSLTNNPVTIDYGNTYMWVKGKTRWNDITMQFYSLSEPDTNKKLWDYLNKHHIVDDGRDLFKDEYMGQITLKLLHPNEKSVGKWKLINAIVSDMSWGNVDWSSDEVIQPEVTFKYDYATWESDPPVESTIV